ncbi:hypothetical protein JTE90_029600 [Oedothorax gibbosus]|uniref:Uncharacterized protein n=1 Tax=Oedothorax gibbosus TaxID=931172 RepID=A0AAV6UTL7_9ARAC|nr:hypothetical protein JTE90_029600 [Oedothorax gibbosus]
MRHRCVLCCGATSTLPLFQNGFRACYVSKEDLSDVAMTSCSGEGESLIKFSCRLDVIFHESYACDLSLRKMLSRHGYRARSW